VVEEGEGEVSKARNRPDGEGMIDRKGPRVRPCVSRFEFS